MRSRLTPVFHLSLQLCQTAGWQGALDCFDCWLFIARSVKASIHKKQVHLVALPPTNGCWNLKSSGTYTTTTMMMALPPCGRSVQAAIVEHKGWKTVQPRGTTQYLLLLLRLKHYGRYRCHNSSPQVCMYICPSRTTELSSYPQKKKNCTYVLNSQLLGRPRVFAFGFCDTNNGGGKRDRKRKRKKPV